MIGITNAKAKSEISKVQITLTGTSGTLTDAQFNQVMNDGLNVEFVLNGRIYRYAEDQISFRTYTNVVYPTDTTQEIKAIYINTSSTAVNYKTWSLEDITITGGSVITFEDYSVGPAPGLYETGTDTLIKSWQTLVNDGDITVSDNCITAGNSEGLVGDLVISNEIVTIGGVAFDGCSGLTDVTIPSSVTLIDVGAFTDCSGLTSIEIPSSVTSIVEYAFSGCSSLTTLIVNANYADTEFGNTLTSGQNYGVGQTPNLINTSEYYDVGWNKVS